MNRIRGLIFPALIILGLAVVPRLLLGVMPSRTVSLASALGVPDPGNVADVLLFFGAILAVLSAIRNFTERGSTTNLTARIASTSMWFILSLYLWGAGDPWCFGVISRTANLIGNVETSYVLNLSFFVGLLAGASMLSAFHAVLVFVRARSQRH
jgi:hypothetical protein